MFFKIYYFSESDEDVFFGFILDLRVFFKEILGVFMDIVSIFVIKDNVF